MNVNEEQWKFIEKEIMRKPTKKEVERLRKIKMQFKDFLL